MSTNVLRPSGGQDQKNISLRSEKGVLVNFESFQLHHRIESGIEALGYTEPHRFNLNAFHPFYKAGTSWAWPRRHG